MAEKRSHPPRNIELRFSMREALVLHGALRDKQVELEKEAWHLGRRGDTGRAELLTERAEENEALAERVFRTLESIMDLPKGSE